MQKEIAQLDEERKREEQELQKARDKEAKYNKYLAKQREKLAGHTQEKMKEEQKKKEQEEQKQKKEAKEKKKKQKEHEAKKRAIAAYKEKKRNAEELLANADLDDLSSDEEFQTYSKQVKRPAAVAESDEDVENSEEDASRYLDKMIQMYSGGDENAQKSAKRKPRPPPAI